MIVRQATFEDEVLIANFYKAIFDNAQYKYPKRWKWLYERNPFYSDNRSLPIWIAIDQGKVVGMSCLMPQHFWAKQHNLKGAWGHDFRVLPEYRGMGIGTQLQKLRIETGSVFSLDASDVVRRINRKLGYLLGPKVIVYLHVKRFNPQSLFDDMFRYLRLSNNIWLYKISHILRLPEFISALLKIVFKCRQYRFRISENEKISLTFKPIDFFPRQVDELWNEIKDQYSLAVIRDHRYLNWKFVNQPHVSYQRFLVYKSSKLCGVLIFRLGQPPELPIGIIAEFYTNQESEILRQMLSFAVSELYRQGSLMIHCSVSTAERSKVLSRMGFIPIRKLLPTFFLGSDSESFYADIAAKGDWLMGFGDQDFDEYRKASHPYLKDLIKASFGRIPGESFTKSFR